MNSASCRTRQIEIQIEDIVHSPEKPPKANNTPTAHHFLEETFLHNEIEKVYQLLEHHALWDYIPLKAQSSWCSLVETVLDNYITACENNNTSDIIKAVTTLIELPQRALKKVRSGHRRGGRQLLTQINTAYKHLKDPLPYNPPATQKDIPSETKRWSKAIGLAHRGHFSQALKTLQQTTLVPIDQPTLETLKNLHPPKQHKQSHPPPPPCEQITVDPKLLKKVIKTKINNGSAPSIPGWNGEMLAAITSSKTALDKLSIFIGDIINGKIPLQVRVLLLSAKLVAGPKSVGVRPIAIGDVFVKTASSYCISLVKPSLANIFEPIQLGAGSKSGVERAIHILRTLLELGSKDVVLLKTDATNAHNAILREAIFSSLYSRKELAPLWNLVYWKYGEATPLIIRMDDGTLTTIPAEEGTAQGCPLAAVLYALAVQPTYEHIAETGGETLTLRSVVDDLNMVGDWKEVISAFKTAIPCYKDVGLTMAPSKCKLLWPHPTPIPIGLRTQCEELGVPIVNTGISTIGAHLGFRHTENKEWALSRIKKSTPLIDILTDSRMPAQLALILTRWCFNTHGTFLAWTMPPSQTSDALSWLDLACKHILTEILDLPELDSQAQQQLELPIQYGGLGFRRQKAIRHIAFISSFATAAPDLAMFLKPLTNYNTPLFYELNHSLAKCHEHGTNTSQLLPAESSAFLSHFTTSDTTINGISLQQALTADQDLACFTNLFTHADSHTRNRLHSLTQQNGAHWTTILPTHQYLQLSSNTLVDTCHLQLNLPTLQLPSNECLCGTDISPTSAFDHFMVCPQTRRKEVTDRHDSIKYTLALLAGQAGMQAHIEPTTFNNSHEHPDLRIIAGTQVIYLDVSIVHPTAQSYLKYGAEKDGYACANREKEKDRMYKERIEAQGDTFFPFVLESYGRFGSQALKVLDIFVKEALKHSPWLSKAPFNVGGNTESFPPFFVETAKSDAAPATVSSLPSPTNHFFPSSSYGRFGSQALKVLDIFVKEALKHSPWLSTGSIQRWWKHRIISSLLVRKERGDGRVPWQREIL
eukprot:CAMPEP_0174275236 /NCGR_PEP_ID=MMETSP0439-20130205/59713_1 /TAXON_ID=0 /ORGANISM="Stereomyxa ramosa, Strain Chinc5" /LENGTH=1043 /DNA_ID=CAMNT_0015367321 /DNA_START=1318 /DNA_END=4450 /DNA_ORIENTATION=-